ncbi:MAG: hypothetical protein J5826_08595 [Bacteroidales bacterium]|nr:hypothetical protein [Bacteroidales bacterium]
MEQKEKELRETTERLIENIVGRFSGYAKRDSTLQSALRIANRQINETPLVSAFLYLNCLDQIGDLFGNKTIINKNGEYNEDRTNPIKQALKMFLPPKIEYQNLNIDALVNLRHSLAHNLSMVNVKGNKKYKFILTVDNNEPMVVINPTNKNGWDGHYYGNVNDVYTSKFNDYDCHTINVAALHHLVEDVLKEIMNQKSTILFAIQDVKDELEDDRFIRYENRLKEITYRFFVYFDIKR